jgi:hypothetical protein
MPNFQSILRDHFANKKPNVYVPLAFFGTKALASNGVAVTLIE